MLATQRVTAGITSTEPDVVAAAAIRSAQFHTVATRNTGPISSLKE